MWDTLQYLQGFDVLLLTETRRAEPLAGLLPGYDVFDVPASQPGRAGEGELVAVKQELSYRAERWLQSEGTQWIILTPLAATHHPLAIAACYIPPSGSPQLERKDLESRMVTLGGQISAACEVGSCLVAGDFNARIADLSEDGPPRPFTDDVVNRHGHALVRLCGETGMQIGTGRLRGDTHAPPTYRRRSNTQPSRLDHVLLSRTDLLRQASCTVNAERMESDHWPLEISICLPASSQPPPQASGRPLHRRRWKPHAQQVYAAALDADPRLAACIAAANEGQLEQASELFHEALAAAADQAGMVQRTSTSCGTRSRPKVFYDQECDRLKREARRAARLSPGSQEARELARQYRSLVRRRMRQQQARRADSLLSDMRRNPRTVFRQLRPRDTAIPQSLQDVHAWDSYLADLADGPPALRGQLGCPVPNPLTSQQRAAAQEAAQRLVEPFSIAEVISTCSRLNNGKASGMMGYPAEMLRYAVLEGGQPAPRHILAPAIASMLNCAFRTGRLPSAWNVSLLCPVHKRGDRCNVANYRPIAVGEPLARLYASAINQRLVSYTETAGLRPDTQAGFRPGLSTAHQLFALQHFIDKHIKLRRPLYVCFVDLKAAYDRVRRPLLWSTLTSLGLAEQMRRAVQSLYADPQLAVSVGGRHGPSQRTTIGVRQGCPLSPTLFGLFLDGLDAYLRRVVPEAGPRLRTGECVPVLTYADDITLMGVDAGQLQRLLNAIHVYCGLVGMQLSPDKSKVMVFARPGPEACTWSCGGEPLEEVQEFKYLGLVFSTVRGLPAALTRLKQNAAGAWAVLQERYRDLHCASHAPLLFELYRTVVPPCASYGCELWGMRRLHMDGEEQRRQIVQQHVARLKQICGVRANVPADIVLLELGVEPVQWHWWSQAIRFWNQLAGMREDSLHRRIALDDVADAFRSDVRNWAWSIHENLAAIGYVMEWREGCMPYIPVATVLRGLRHARELRLGNADICPRTAASAGVKLCTYLRWFAPPRSRGLVLHIPVRAEQMKKFIRFRLGCHDLPVEVGRHTGVPRRCRLCLRCTLGAVGDEKHMIFECPAVAALRVQYAHLFAASIQDMRQFMWQDDRVGVVRFVLQALQLMRGGIDEEGAD